MDAKRKAELRRIAESKRWSRPELTELLDALDGWQCVTAEARAEADAERKRANAAVARGQNLARALLLHVKVAQEHQCSAWAVEEAIKEFERDERIALNNWRADEKAAAVNATEMPKP